MNVAQNRDNRRAVVNRGRIFGLHKMRKKFGSLWNFELLQKEYDPFIYLFIYLIIYLLRLQAHAQLLSQTFFYTLKTVNKATV
jgi:hypothetical protein